MSHKLLEYIQRIEHGDTTLTVIDLSGQGISTAQISLLFRRLSTNKVVANSIAVIILSNNSITCLPPMPKLPSLAKIFLDHNKLDKPPELREPSIELVDLSHNLIESPPNLRNLVNLKYLDLRSNPMHVLPDMSTNTQLSLVRLDHLPLTYLDYVALKMLAQRRCEICVLHSITINELIAHEGTQVPLDTVFTNYINKFKDALRCTLPPDDFVRKCFILSKLLDTTELACLVLECLEDTPYNYLKAFMKKIQGMLPNNPRLEPHYNSYIQSKDYMRESQAFSNALLATVKKTLKTVDSVSSSKRLRMKV